MEIRVLKYFLAAAREENITKAAESLFISQPALSRQLMQLEEELGVKLFVRGQHSITLTEEGMFFRRRAQEIVDLAEKTKTEFKGNDENLSGTIAIGSGELTAVRVLSDWIKTFNEQYPDVTFDIYSGDTDHIKERLERGSLDLGILLEPTDLAKYAYIRMPVFERFGIIAHKDNPLAQKESITAADLIGQRVSAPKRSANRSMLAVWYGDTLDKIDIHTTHNLIYNTAIFVENGYEAAITLEGAISLYHNPNIVFKPLSPEVLLTSVIAWKQMQPVSKATDKFIKHIRNAIQL